MYTKYRFVKGIVRIMKHEHDFRGSINKDDHKCIFGLKQRQSLYVRMQSSCVRRSSKGRGIVFSKKRVF